MEFREKNKNTKKNATPNYRMINKSPDLREEKLFDAMTIP